MSNTQNRRDPPATVPQFPTGTYFLYGTLLNADTFNTLLNLDYEPSFTKAVLRGHRLRRRPPLPALVPCDGPGRLNEVSGVCFDVKFEEHAVTLFNYEFAFYRVKPVNVLTEHGQHRAAWTFGWAGPDGDLQDTGERPRDDRRRKMSEVVSAKKRTLDANDLEEQKLDPGRDHERAWQVKVGSSLPPVWPFLAAPLPPEKVYFFSSAFINRNQLNFPMGLYFLSDKFLDHNNLKDILSLDNEPKSTLAALPYHDNEQNPRFHPSVVPSDNNGSPFDPEVWGACIDIKTKPHAVALAAYASRTDLIKGSATKIMRVEMVDMDTEDRGKRIRGERFKAWAFVGVDPTVNWSDVEGEFRESTEDEPEPLDGGERKEILDRASVERRRHEAEEREIVAAITRDREARDAEAQRISELATQHERDAELTDQRKHVSDLPDRHERDAEATDEFPRNSEEDDRELDAEVERERGERDRSGGRVEELDIADAGERGYSVDVREERIEDERTWEPEDIDFAEECYRRRAADPDRRDSRVDERGDWWGEDEKPPLAFRNGF